MARSASPIPLLTQKANHRPAPVMNTLETERLFGPKRIINEWTGKREAKAHGSSKIEIIGPRPPTEPCPDIRPDIIEDPEAEWK